jgi:hypothetical protein
MHRELEENTLSLGKKGHKNVTNFLYSPFVSGCLGHETAFSPEVC